MAGASSPLMLSSTVVFVSSESGPDFRVSCTSRRDNCSLPLASGFEVVRTTSNPDANGKLQLSRREVQETRKSGPDSEETKTTVLLNINGELAPAMQMQERQKRSGEMVSIQKTTLLSDGAGGWQVGEIRQAT